MERNNTTKRTDKLFEQTSYGFFTLSENQTTNLAAGDPIQLDTVEGDIALSGYQITLKANIRYDLNGVIRVYNSASYLDYRWYDVSNSTWIGKGASSNTAPYADTYSSQQIAKCIIVPSTDIIVELRIVGAEGSSLYIDSGLSFAYIKSLENVIPITRNYNNEKKVGFLTLSADQSTNLTPGEPIRFNQLQGDFELNNYQINLKANKRYLLEASLTSNSTTTTSNYITFKWYDITHSEWLGVEGYNISVSYLTTGESTGKIAKALLTPTEDVIIELRVFGNGGNNVNEIKTNGSYAYIETIESHVPIRKIETSPINGIQTEIKTVYFEGQLTTSPFNISHNLPNENKILTCNIMIYENTLGYRVGGEQFTLDTTRAYRSYIKNGLITIEFGSEFNNQNYKIEIKYHD